VVPDGIGRRHVVVTVTADYEIPFGGFLSIIKQDSTKRYVATASADCMDIIDYYTTVSFAKSCTQNLRIIAK